MGGRKARTAAEFSRDGRGCRVSRVRLKRRVFNVLEGSAGRRDDECVGGPRPEHYADKCFFKRGMFPVSFEAHPYWPVTWSISEQRCNGSKQGAFHLC